MRILHSRFVFATLLGLIFGAALAGEAREITSVGAPATILPAEVMPAKVPPNSKATLRMHFDAVPMSDDHEVFVSIVDNSGRVAFRANHKPPFPTRMSTWSGRQDYTRNVNVPKITDGEYAIIAGIRGRDGERHSLIAGSGVTSVGNHAYQVGTLIVDSTASPPPLDTQHKPVTLNLDSFELTFNEEFDGPLDVSPRGPGTRWIAHLPYGGGFGNATFADPGDEFPFTLDEGLLRIEARKAGSKWESGLLCSVDTEGRGFLQRYGYFEMRAKFPRGPGTWPAFWLLTPERLRSDTRRSFEIDIVEQYGHSSQRLHNVVHWWNADGTHRGTGQVFWVEDMSTDFHTYGCMLDEQFLVFYFDGKEMWRMETPEEAKQEMYLVLNLAMGAGWPMDQTPNPSYMYVDYVRVYARTRD